MYRNCLWAPAPLDKTRRFYAGALAFLPTFHLCHWSSLHPRCGSNVHHSANSACTNSDSRRSSNNGASIGVQRDITVTNRTNFGFTAVAPVQLKGPPLPNSITCYNGLTTTLASPPSSTSFKGASCYDGAFSYSPSAPISGGPNSGYQYVTSVSPDASQTQPTKYEFIVLPDVLSATTFYKAQCGNYSSSNASGFIAGSQLSQNIFDHEQGSVLSHYSQYVSAQNNTANNVGDVLESTVATPGTSSATFTKTLNDTATAAINRIDAAAAPEPCNDQPERDSSQSCFFCGAINYSPYKSCAGTPVPHCQ